MTRGAIYQHLNELARKGIVITYEKGGRKYFKITARGKQILRSIDELKTLL